MIGFLILLFVVSNHLSSIFIFIVLLFDFAYILYCLVLFNIHSNSSYKYNFSQIAKTSVNKLFKNYIYIICFILIIFGTISCFYNENRSGATTLFFISILHSYIIKIENRQHFWGERSFKNPFSIYGYLGFFVFIYWMIITAIFESINNSNVGVSLVDTFVAWFHALFAFAVFTIIDIFNYNKAK